MPRHARTRSSKLETPNARALVAPLLRWFARHARDLPWRRTRDPYAIWISEIMLQQTQVKTVIPYWRRWMRRLPDVRALARARSDAVLKLWEGLGYYLRARNLQKAARIIVDHHRGRFPETFEEILALPGIGRYTAGAICSIAFNQPTPVLDGNVVRVLSRVFGVAGNSQEKVTNKRLWRIAGELVQQAAEMKGNRPRSGVRATRRCSHFNQSLMELGALICRPKEPKCSLCPIAKQCVAFQQDRVQELPRLSKRLPPTKRRFVAFVAEKRGRVLVRQR